MEGLYLPPRRRKAVPMTLRLHGTTAMARLMSIFNATNTLGGTVSYTENGSAVVLDSNVQIFDAELSSSNNFSGATLTLARIGGADAKIAFLGHGSFEHTHAGRKPGCQRCDNRYGYYE